MQKKLLIALAALGSVSMGYAQQDSVNVGEQAFTFTEAQLGEDENVTQSVSIISSGTNAYANEVGYRWSPMRFKYRAYNAKYNDIYINGNPVNDIERGDFRYSFVGGLNNQTRSMESALPFEPNNFSMTGLGGSNNYNFRPSAMPVGQRLSLGRRQPQLHAARHVQLQLWAQRQRMGVVGRTDLPLGQTAAMSKARSTTR